MGPLAVPGTYQAKLAVAGKSYTAPLEIKADPRVQASRADLQKQFELAIQIRDRASAALEAVNQIRALRAQLESLRKRLASNAQYKPIATAAEQLGKKMTSVEEALIQAKSKSSEDPLNYPIRLSEKLMALHGTVESADAAPTQQSYEVFQELSGKVEGQLAQWREIVSKDLAALNEMMRKENVPVLSVAPAAPTSAVATSPLSSATSARAFEVASK